MKLKNRLLMLPRYFAWRSGRIAPAVPPDRIYIETTNRCNLQCPQCPTGLDITGRDQGDMDEGLFRKIIREIRPWAQTAVLHIWGEPLMNPRIIEWIGSGAEAGLKTEISTNAMLLDETRAKGLVQSGLSRIYLCIDGVDEATYNRIRVGGDFNRVKSNIQRFIRLNREAGCPVAIQVQLIDIDLTRPQISDFRREWTLPGVEGVNIKAFDSWGGRVESINEMNQGGKIITLPRRRYPCPNLWYHAHIFFDGTLVCCDRDFDLSNPLGSVEEGVLRAWKGPGMRSLRTAHAANQIEVAPCRDCREWAWWKPGIFSSWGNAPRGDSFP